MAYLALRHNAHKRTCPFDLYLNTAGDTTLNTHGSISIYLLSESQLCFILQNHHNLSITSGYNSCLPRSSDMSPYKINPTSKQNHYKQKSLKSFFRKRISLSEDTQSCLKIFN